MVKLVILRQNEVFFLGGGRTGGTRPKKNGGIMAQKSHLHGFMGR